ncbi:MAG: IS1 family transposase [Xanthobacteraceae bacterium]|nr:IS1 family transposase [Xanthobacteraceae bacterium]
MNRLDAKGRAQILHLLCEGNSIRAVTRLTGASKNTVTKLMIDAGRACDDYHHWKVHGLQSKRVQVDEIWSFVYSKQANAPKTKNQVKGRGDCWTWTAIDADSKFLISYYVGTRDGESAFFFLSDLKSRLAGRVQLTSDGHNAYYRAVADSFGEKEVDYAQLVKLYGSPKEGAPGSAERRYSPAVCTGAKPFAVFGKPERRHVSTSYAERQNLNLRMHNRRFTRLTNAFSKKLENHYWAIALFTFYYNFVRIHKTLRVTPAMAAGVTDKLWEMSDMVQMLEAFEAKQIEAKRNHALEPAGAWE